MIDLDELIAESHQAEVKVLAMSKTAAPALALSVIKTIQRLAAALEAAPLNAGGRSDDY